MGFYKKLQIPESFRKTRTYDTVVQLVAYNIELEIFVDPNNLERTTEMESIGYRYLALKVDNRGDTADELGDEGFELGVANIMNDWVGKRFYYITDPDGLLTEY